MSITKRTFSILALLVTIILVSCSMQYDEESLPAPSCPAPHVTRPQESNEAFYTVMADENLPEGQKIAILQALNEWSTKTNFTMTYKLTFVDMTPINPDTSLSHTIKVYKRDPGPGLAGWTLWSASNHSAYMFIHPSMDDDTFRRTMLHELGHAFDLHFGEDIHYHGPNQSIMYPGLGQASTNLCCPDLKAFCEKHCCVVECENVPQAKGNLEIVSKPIAEQQVD